MTVRVIREAGLVRRPWKNGGGATAEIAVCPADADFDTFDWRVSMADVASDGPFSLFPGIDRTLVLIGGEALILDVDGSRHRLDTAAPVLAFKGDVQTFGHLQGEPVRDFNVMTRRRRFTHKVMQVPRGTVPIRCEALLLAHPGPLAATVAGETYHLAPLDALLTEGLGMIDLDAPALLTQFAPVRPPPAQPPA